MNKKLALFAAMGMAGATSALAALDIKVEAQQPNLSGGQGGAFLVTLNNSGSVPGAVTGTIPGEGATHPIANNQFLSFCVEHNENLSLGGSYNVAVNTGAVAGGVLGGNPDNLSKATAWLFSEFTKGTLDNVAGFDYDSAGGVDLQNAIWYLEQEIGTATAGSLYLLNAAIAATGFIDYAAAIADSSGGYNVRVLNLLPTPTQDILVVVPEPSTYIAGGLALLPLLFGLRYRFAKK